MPMYVLLLGLGSSVSLAVTVGKQGLGLVLTLLLALFAIFTVVLDDIEKEEAVGDANDKEEPEEVESLQGGEQDNSNVLRDPALVLLGGPVELKGADSAELGKEGVDDAQVEVMAHVDPDGHEEGKVRALERAVDVVERLGGLLKEC